MLQLPSRSWKSPSLKRSPPLVEAAADEKPPQGTIVPALATQRFPLASTARIFKGWVSVELADAHTARRTFSL
jgi:hypothetical protein